MNLAHVNLAQRIAIAATAIALALFLLTGGRHIIRQYPGGYIVGGPDVGQTVMDSIGILLLGGAATWLLGIKSRKQKPSE